MSTRIQDVVEQAEAALEELRDSRAKLVAQIDLQIKQMEVGVAALREAAKIAHSKQESGKSPLPPFEAPRPTENGSHTRDSLTAAQRVVKFLNEHPGSTNLQLMDALEKYVTGSKTKSARRVVSGAIWDLKNRGMVRIEDQDKLFLVTTEE
jgi:hypothetical protein